MKKAITFILTLAAFTALGSVYQLSVVPYVVVASVVIITILVATNKISVRHYPVYMFGLALALIWQTSMLGTYIVGVDIHSEYFVAVQVIEYGWDWGWTNVGNTSVILTLLTPALAKSGIDPVWQFKALFPFVCAFVPVVLYYAFRRVFGEKRAYFGVLFFMIMPMFTMEAVSMVKSQWAYLCLAGTVFMLTSTIKPWKRTLGISVLAIGTIVCHYTVGVITLFYLIGIFLVLALTNWWRLRRLLGERTLPVKYLAVAVLCTAVFFGTWFTNIGEGRMISQVTSIFGGVATNLKQIALVTEKPTYDSSVKVIDTPRTEVLDDTAKTEEVDDTGLPKTILRDELPDTIEGQTAKARAGDMMGYVRPVKSETYLDRQPPLIRSAIGLDFGLVSNWGKAFRVFHYLTEILLVVGLFVLLRRRKEFTAEYVAGVLGSFLLLACALFLPFFTVMTISTTRLYVITLFFVSPLLILGVEQTTTLASSVYRRTR